MVKCKINKWMVAILSLVCVASLNISSVGSRQSQHKTRSLGIVIAGSTSPASQDDDVEKVLRLIKSTPAWADVDEKDSNTQQAIIENLKRISAFNIQVIRQAIKAYVESTSLGTANYQSYFSRIVVINRFLFNLPTTPLPANEIKRFGGWVGRPRQDCETVWSWPLSLDASGKLKLTGTLEMYMGPRYRPLEEFDFLYEKFGFRVYRPSKK